MLDLEFEIAVLWLLVFAILAALPMFAWWMTPAYTNAGSKGRLCLYAAVALMMLVSSGVAHALRTDRWFVSEQVQEAANRLEKIPTEFGSWRSEAVASDPEMLKIAEAQGCFSRRFYNDESGQVFHVLILCGRPGPIAVHTPDVCFVAAGQQMLAKERFEANSDSDGNLGEFYVGDFVNTTEGITHQMRTFWAWSTEGQWRVAENTRTAFATSPFLYKMYVSRGVPIRSVLQPTDTTVDFLEEFLPLVTDVLFPKR